MDLPGLFSLQRSDVPLERDASGRFLPWLIAFMVYLAALSLASVMAAHKITARWDQGLSARLTVQVPPPDPAVGREDMAGHVAEVQASLLATPGIADAEVLPEERIEALLRPWLGDGVLDDNLPLPALIAVETDRGTPLDLGALAVRLERVAPGATIDDHQQWLGNVLDLAETIETVAAMVVLAVSFCAVITVIFVTRTGLAIHRQVIELLHLIGAQDSYIARQFQGHALRLGLVGGAMGLVLALFTVILIGYLLERTQSGLLPSLTLSAGQVLVLLSLPVATGAVAMITARLTVLLNLTRAA